MFPPPPSSTLFPYTTLFRSVRPRVRALRREGRDRRGAPERAHRDPFGHDLYTARPRALLRLSAALRRAGAAGRAAPPQEIQGCEGDAQFLRRHAGGGSSARARVLRRVGPLPPGTRAVVLGLQFLRGAARRDRPPPTEPGH